MTTKYGCSDISSDWGEILDDGSVTGCLVFEGYDGWIVYYKDTYDGHYCGFNIMSSDNEMLFGIDKTVLRNIK